MQSCPAAHCRSDLQSSFVASPTVQTFAAQVPPEAAQSPADVQEHGPLRDARFEYPMVPQFAHRPFATLQVPWNIRGRARVAMMRLPFGSSPHCASVEHAIESHVHRHRDWQTFTADDTSLTVAAQASPVLLFWQSALTVQVLRHRREPASPTHAYPAPHAAVVSHEQ
jgi:hypothetical protein